MLAMLDEVAGLIRAGDFEEASRRIGAIEETDENRTDVIFLRGWADECQHNWEAAAEAYEKVLEINPDHTEALFRHALLCDRRGDDDSAMEHYDKCSSGEQVHVNVLLNKAVLLEEAGRLAEAKRCVGQVLKEFPNNVRADYLMRSIEASGTMVFDERTQREREIRSAVLDVPVTDFELSVRSRNCLKQMNIRTLGDLLKTTEEELLSYKNFGETSLNEIKAMLVQKGLRLGQAAQEAKAEEAKTLSSMIAMGGDQASVLNKLVSEMELSVRSRKCLQRLGISTLGELTMRTEAELMATKNFGQTSLSEIKRQLVHYGVELRKVD